MSRSLRFDDLPYQERLLIWSLRMSYAPHISEQDTARALEHAFRFATIEQALPDFSGYTNAVATCLMDAQLTVHIHCPPCASISRDEWHIVQTIAALQAFDRVLASSYLEPLLPPAGVRLCCDMGAVVARTFNRLNFRLLNPRRRSAVTTSHCHHSEATISAHTTPVLH
jgi:hypothetical protein